MPFNPPFKNTYSLGDLFYGFHPKRADLIKYFATTILNNNNGERMTVDQFKRGAVQGMPDAIQSAWKQFIVSNKQHPNYARYSDAIKGYGKYGYDEDAFAKAETNAAALNSAWRAKSKFGLDWALRNNIGHIHFVLDGIDMAAVVTKTHNFTDGGKVLAEDSPRGKAPDDAEKERTITHSELRWIYRNRNNPQVRQGVQFWLTSGTMQPCGAPWEDTVRTTIMPTSGASKTWKEAWNIYRPKEEHAEFLPELPVTK
jgi:hypothetical protein